MGIRFDKLRNTVVDRSSDAASSVADTIPGDVKDLAKSLGSDRPTVGKLGDDRLVGTNKSDVILADPTVEDDVGGDDMVDGRKGDDTIYTFGGNGNDVIQTADGDDWIDAGPG